MHKEGDDNSDQPVVEVVEPSDKETAEPVAETALAVTPEEPAKREAPADASVHLSISKKLVWLLGVLVVLGAGSAFAYKRGYYQPLVNRYERGDVIIKVKEGDKYPVAGASISIGGKTYTTDENGRVSIDAITAGSYAVAITKDGYVPVSQTLVLHRKDNPLQIYSMEKQPAKLYTVKGFVQDYVSGQPLVNVQVTLDGKTVTTNPNGEYDFTDVAPKAVSLALHKQGYADQTLSQTVVDQDVVTAKVPLVPSGQVVFVSNRDGSRALYTAAYDGSSQQRLVDPAGGEDFAPVLSPDGKTVAFSSTRDKLKDSGGQPLAKLYVAGIDGKNLKKVSDAVASAFSPVWSPDGRQLYFSGYADPSLSRATYTVYNASTGKSLDIGEAVSELAFSPNGGSLAYTVFGQSEVSVASPTPSPLASPDPSATPAPAANASVQNVYFLKTIDLGSGTRKTLATRPQFMSNLIFSTDNASVAYDVTLDSGLHRFSDVIASGTESEVATLPVTKRVYVPSPDGKRQAFVEVRDGKRDLFTVDMQGANEQRLTTLGTLDEFIAPHWDASGNYLTFAVSREGENGIYIVSTTGGDPKKIADYYQDR